MKYSDKGFCPLSNLAVCIYMPPKIDGELRVDVGRTDHTSRTDGQCTVRVADSRKAIDVRMVLCKPE